MPKITHQTQRAAAVVAAEQRSNRAAQPSFPNDWPSQHKLATVRKAITMIRSGGTPKNDRAGQLAQGAMQAASGIVGALLLGGYLRVFAIIAPLHGGIFAWNVGGTEAAKGFSKLMHYAQHTNVRQESARRSLQSAQEHLQEDFATALPAAIEAVQEYAIYIRWLAAWMLADVDRCGRGASVKTLQPICTELQQRLPKVQTVNELDAMAQVLTRQGE